MSNRLHYLLSLVGDFALCLWLTILPCKHTSAMFPCKTLLSPFRIHHGHLFFSSILTSSSHFCSFSSSTHSSRLSCINHSISINVPLYFQCPESWVTIEFHQLPCRWQNKYLKMFGASKAESGKHFLTERNKAALPKTSWNALFSFGWKAALPEHCHLGLLAFFLLLLRWNSREVYAPALGKKQILIEMLK